MRTKKLSLVFVPIFLFFQNVTYADKWEQLNVEVRNQSGRTYTVSKWPIPPFPNCVRQISEDKVINHTETTTYSFNINFDPICIGVQKNFAIMVFPTNSTNELANAVYQIRLNNRQLEKGKSQGSSAIEVNGMDITITK